MSPSVANEKVKWVCNFSTIHLGNVLADLFALDKTILGSCSTYTSICSNTNAISEISKVPKLLSVFADDFNSDLNIIDILLNRPTEAIGYLQNSLFLERVCRNPEAIRLLVKNPSYCSVVYGTISRHRSTIENSLKNYSVNISKGTINVGNGVGTYNWGGSAPYIVIPKFCYDDKTDTDFNVYSCDSATSIAYIKRHTGNTAITQGVCLRGTKVVGTGSSTGYVGFDYYYLP